MHKRKNNVRYMTKLTEKYPHKSHKKIFSNLMGLFRIWRKFII